MTTQRTAIQNAIEALEKALREMDRVDDGYCIAHCVEQNCAAALSGLRTALAEPQPCQPNKILQAIEDKVFLHPDQFNGVYRDEYKTGYNRGVMACTAAITQCLKEHAIASMSSPNKRGTACSCLACDPKHGEIGRDCDHPERWRV